MRRGLRWLLIGVPLLLLAVMAAVLVRSGVRSLDEPLNVAAPVRFKVAVGARFGHVASDLATRRIVPDPKAWIVFARWRGLAAAIKAGEYEIDPGTTPRQLLFKMVNGQVVLHSFTIVDGWEVKDLLAAMRRNPDIVMTLPLAPAGTISSGLMDSIGAAGVAPEGQFLPETYRFPTGTTDVELLREAHGALVRELTAAWKDRSPDLPLHSAEELLIMASIIEKESGLPQELPKIAGLYLHRLAIGMRLQADPTVIYGLGDRYDGDIHTVDLRTDGAYNTYTRTGLPPTAIALPGAAAIRATARPQDTDALYFVASAKGDGSHVFSATLKEHNVAVAAYVARQRAVAR